MTTEELPVVHRSYRKKSSTPSTQFFRQRSMSVSDESSADVLPDPPVIPTVDRSKHRNRRHSEFQTNILINNRRNSAFQTPFWTNLFRSTSKSHLKNPSTIEQMPMKNEPLLSSTKFMNSTSLSHERLSPLTQIESSFTFPATIFTLDSSVNEPRSAENFILQLQTPLALSKIYRDEFYSFFHTNYAGDLESDGPFLLSLRCILTDENEYETRALIRTSTRNCDVSIKTSNIHNERLLQSLVEQANLSSIQTCKVIGDPRANEKIEAFDKKTEERQNSKVGLIVQRANQKDEFDLFANDGLSDALEDFLEFLGEKVRLKGFQRFRGDLDIREDLHGLYSFYTQYGNYEIMFNVAPLIPSSKANGQCIERKGLVSNAFVCVVFQEEGQVEFSPEFISGKVTQVYLVVQPLTIQDELYFKVAVWHRNDLTSIIDPPGGIFKFDPSFRDYFLTLLLNAIHVAIESPSLRSRVFEQRQRLKSEELKKLLQDLTSFPSFEQIFNLETINSLSDLRLNSRTESFVNIPSSTLNSTTTNNENLPSTSNTNSTGRISPVTTKKGRISRLFDVFTTKTTNPPVITTPIPPPPAAVPVVVEKEPIKRKASVKLTHAPPRPTTITPAVSTHRPIQSIQSIPAMHDGNSSPIHPDRPSSPEIVGRMRSNTLPATGTILPKSLSPMIPSINEENSLTTTSFSSEVPSFDLS